MTMVMTAPHDDDDSSAGGGLSARATAQEVGDMLQAAAILTALCELGANDPDAHVRAYAARVSDLAESLRGFTNRQDPPQGHGLADGVTEHIQLLEHWLPPRPASDDTPPEPAPRPRHQCPPEPGGSCAQGRPDPKVHRVLLEQVSPGRWTWWAGVGARTCSVADRGDQPGCSFVPGATASVPGAAGWPAGRTVGLFAR